jgi:hypothetical protein
MTENQVGKIIVFVTGDQSDYLLPVSRSELLRTFPIQFIFIIHIPLLVFGTTGTTRYLTYITRDRVIPDLGDLCKLVR